MNIAKGNSVRDRTEKGKNVMKRVMLTVAYDGTNYHGWQIQPNVVTVESVLNETLSTLCKRKSK